MYYPVFMDLKDRRVLVVGGGTVATRKVEALVDAGARVMVVAPQVTEAIEELAGSGSIQIHHRDFQEGDLDGVLLVVTATDQIGVQNHVASCARARNVPVNTVDQPHLCDFIVPAIVRRGDIVVAISTSGQSPALAAALRGKLDEIVGANAARAVRVLGDVRAEVHAKFSDPDARKAVFENIVASGILDWIGECDDPTALARVRAIIESQ